MVALPPGPTCRKCNRMAYAPHDCTMCLVLGQDSRQRESLHFWRLTISPRIAALETICRTEDGCERCEWIGLSLDYWVPTRGRASGGSAEIESNRSDAETPSRFDSVNGAKRGFLDLPSPPRGFCWRAAAPGLVLHTTGHAKRRKRNRFSVFALVWPVAQSTRECGKAGENGSLRTQRRVYSRAIEAGVLGMSVESHQLDVDYRRATHVAVLLRNV